MSFRILGWVFLRRSFSDYIALLLLGLIPVLVAWSVGAGQSVADYHGFIDRKNYNWLLLLFVYLPTALFLARYFWQRLLPKAPEDVPVLDPVRDEDERQRAYAIFRAQTLSKTTVFLILVPSVVLAVIDFWDQPGQFYYRYLIRGESVTQLHHSLPPNAKDWTTLFVAHRLPGLAIPNPIGVSYNLVLSLTAYTFQLIIAILSFSLIVLFYQYNRAFLGMIYQRRYIEQGHFRPIIIDLTDEWKKFGFRRTNQVFSAQVLTVFTAGLYILASRFSNLQEPSSKAIDRVVLNVAKLFRFEFDPDAVQAMWDAVVGGAVFDDKGQAILCTCWILFFSIAMMPICIKMLPVYPNPLMRLDLIDYLREFLPDGRWIPDGLWEWGANPTHEAARIVQTDVAGKFAHHDFWPNGDRKAQAAFFLAFFIFLIMLFPHAPQPSQEGRALLFYGFLGATAGTLTLAVFKGLHWWLALVDPVLVKKKE